jgi:hypothetical protein
MSQVLQNFNAMLQQFKRKTYDFLDTSITQFDKDYVDFNKYPPSPFSIFLSPYSHRSSLICLASVTIPVSNVKFFFEGF